MLLLKITILGRLFMPQILSKLGIFLLWVMNWKQKAGKTERRQFLEKLSSFSCYSIEKVHKKRIFIIKCRLKCYFSRKKFGNLLNNA